MLSAVFVIDLGAAVETIVRDFEEFEFLTLMYAFIPGAVLIPMWSSTNDPP